jgi:hypothetical protein
MVAAIQMRRPVMKEPCQNRGKSGDCPGVPTSPTSARFKGNWHCLMYARPSNYCVKMAFDQQDIRDW